MTLSDKRKKLLKDLLWTRQRYSSYNLLKKAFELIELQDKQFIKNLENKSEVVSWGRGGRMVWFDDIIVEAGKELVE